MNPNPLNPDPPALFYRELAPPAALRHLVLSFWEFTVTSPTPAPIRHEVFPDGCISISFRKNAVIKFGGFSVNGLNSRSVVFDVYNGDIYWGMRLSPAAALAVLRTDPAGVTPMFFREFAGEFGIIDDDLSKALWAAASLEDAAEIYGARIANFNIAPSDVDQKVQRAIELIEESGGEIRIADLAGELDLSIRQLERRFRKCAGLSPKQYARTRRFRSAAVILVGDDEVSWATRAAEKGFADQAHLTHEFSSLTGRSPTSFAEKVKEIDHGDLV